MHRRALAPIIISLLATSGAALADFDLEATRAAVRAAGADFTVGETSMTRLSVQERAARAMPSYPFPKGFAPASPEQSAGESSSATVWSNGSIPYFSWDDQNGACYSTPAKDQGICNACFAFASLAAMEAQYRIARGEPDFAIDLSEQEVVSCIVPGDSCSTGGAAEQVGLYLQGIGVADESCLPYASGYSGDEGRCDATCDDVQDRRHSIAGWYMSTLPWGIERIKQELLVAPVIANMQLYDDFYAYTGGVYRRTSDQSRGWHVVLILGWDDSDNSWIAKNSWGAGWGMAGYFKISREEHECLPWWPIGSFEGTCFAAHTTVFQVTAAEAYSATEVDAGTPLQPDAGSVADAATGIDSGAPLQQLDAAVPDAAIVEPDAAVAEPDATEPDATEPDVDAAVAEPDAASEPPIEVDAGTPFTDAGQIEPDAAVMDEDAGGVAAMPDEASHEADLGCRSLRSSSNRLTSALLLLAALWLAGLRRWRAGR